MDRLTEVHNFVHGRWDAPPPSQATVHFFEDLRIEHAGGFELAGGFGRTECLEEHIVVQVLPAMSVRPWTQFGENTSLPIDERTITIECERGEVVYAYHRDVSLCPLRIDAFRLHWRTQRASDIKLRGPNSASGVRIMQNNHANDPARRPAHDLVGKSGTCQSYSTISESANGHPQYV